jgi:hypothetical protein
MKFSERPLSANATFKLCYRKNKRRTSEKLDMASPMDFLKYASKRRHKEDPEFAYDEQQQRMQFKTKELKKKRQRDKVNDLAEKKHLRAN